MTGSNMDKELTLFFKQVDTVAALKLTVPQMSRIETVWENEVQQKMLGMPNNVVMAYVVMAYIVMAYIVMAYIVMRI